ncbi:DUF2158 domain-containing protein [Pseudolabrys taiwanensis]|uniref:DUF2158 domain-containing protein n=1 Tax=Pseudolabrys taiwanensis TaxID=331696 RepID=A0A346A4V9_9HYPH|nr:DUF2158 domain-containing protein [Pseudolabrys taiwanensis]AXK84206.1 DUF2158 domain-containing protein [Pseudolabrys taiwanensis]
MAFEAGEVVVLKSGGHAMTVISVDADQAQCIWTGEDGDLFRETIPTVALESAQEIDAEDEAEDDEDAALDDEDEEGHAEKELSPA